MFKNHLKVAVRSLLKQKEFSLLNLLGLALGLTCSLLILLWIQHQKSYDAFHSKADTIYQVLCNMKSGDGAIATWKGTPYPYSQSLQNDYPEVENMVITTYERKHFLRVGNKNIKENGIYASETFFQLFDFRILKGNPNELLNAPNKIVISEKQAKKFFGNLWESAVGNTIQINEQDDYYISGVFADVPITSSLEFEYILPFKKLLADNENLSNDYGNYSYPIFVQLKEGTDRTVLIDQLLAQTDKKLTSQDFYTTPEGMILHPFTERHLYNKFENGKVAGGRIEYVQLFFWFALFILLIACINYMNLATARASQRAKEVGIRKTIGAGRSNLLGQFFMEAVVVTGIASTIAIGAVHLLLPWFNELVGTAIIAPFNQASTWIIIGIVFASALLLAGLYPAFLLSSFKIEKILKGELSSGLSAGKLRRGLVVFQFLISALAIIGAVGMRQQMHYLQNKDLGLDRRNMLIIPANNQLAEKYSIFKEQLSKQPSIASISAASQSPVSINNSTSDPTWEGFTEDQRTLFRRLIADFDFLESMKIPLVAGRFAEKERVADSTAIVINERTARVMGTDNPIGKTLNFWDRDFRIVGMVKDFHLSSLHSEIAPLIVVSSQDWFSGLYIRPAVGKTKEAIAATEEVFKSIAPAYPYEYSFMDTQYEEMYKLDQTTSSIADLFALIALLISALGLLGLAAFSAERRTKEIGIRKVLGASVSQLVALLSKDFIRLVLLALLIAMPLGWYGLNLWLQNFAYHIDINWMTYAIMIGSALLVAGLTVGFQAFRAAIANPIDAIKTE